MSRNLKRFVQVGGAVIAALALVVAVYVAFEAAAFDASMAKVYAVASPDIARSTDPAVIARGRHLAESIGGCASESCHGADLSGGIPKKFGPLGTITGPNLTPGGDVATYTDAELARVVRHGLKKDGRSLRFMPAQNFSWLPDRDLTALVSFLRSVPKVDRPNGVVSIGVLGKVLDRRDRIAIDIARRIDHAAAEAPPVPGATPAYGALLARACVSCHGEHLSGGPIPGAPASMAVPANITPDDSGIKDYTFEDFDRVLRSGIKRNGKKLDPFMPYESLGKLDDVEKRALWAYLRSVPATRFGNR